MRKQGHPGNSESKNILLTQDLGPTVTFARRLIGRCQSLPLFTSISQHQQLCLDLCLTVRFSSYFYEQQFLTMNQMRVGGQRQPYHLLVHALRLSRHYCMLAYKIHTPSFHSHKSPILFFQLDREVSGPRERPPRTSSKPVVLALGHASEGSVGRAG